ncbi:MAG TPA: hypothetical protein VNR66_10670 [Solirubrobacteraceae bacterium]|nr:hypothetical protein [Solirubrobacteraceae bacterium]
MASDDAQLDLDLIAASLRADTSDLSAFVESLADKLQQVMPGRVRIDRRRTGLSGPKRVRRIALDAGNERLELEVDKGVIATRRARLSGGIVLKNEALETEEWLAALGGALATEAERSATTRQALERLLLQ